MPKRAPAFHTGMEFKKEVESMTLSILSCVALIALVGGAVYAIIGAVQARRAGDPQEEVKGPKKLSRAQVGICIAGGGFAVLVLSLLGVLH
jgi:hypothetical protein